MPLILTLKGMFPPAGTTPNQRVPPDGGGVWGGAVNGALTPGMTPPPPAITVPPAGASEPPPAMLLMSRWQRQATRHLQLRLPRRLLRLLQLRHRPRAP